MALAEKLLAAEFNRDGHELVDHRTWVCLGDGCLMEGVSQEALSLAQFKLPLKTKFVVRPDYVAPEGPVRL